MHAPAEYESDTDIEDEDNYLAGYAREDRGPTVDSSQGRLVRFDGGFGGGAADVPLIANPLQQQGSGGGGAGGQPSAPTLRDRMLDLHFDV